MIAWMRRLEGLIITAVVLFAMSAPCKASDQARQFIAGLEAYQNSDYDLAIQRFNTLVKSGVRNGKLFYNLGNAYLKNDALGLAILWYERAMDLSPNDPDLHFNLAYARSLTRDAMEEGPTPLARIFFFWKYQLSTATIKIVALAANLLFWLLAIAWRMTGRRGLRRAAIVVLVPAAIFILTAAYNYYEAAHLKQAVVLPQQISVRSGLEDTSTELFVLHAGAKVRVVRQHLNHYQIRFSKDKIGWVDKEALGLIWSPSHS